MAYSDTYRAQVELLIQTLSHVANEECFALKGGTAINLFIRNMPRLSVDIDLTFLPIADRTTSLTAIDAALKRIAESIRQSDSTIQITESAPCTQAQITKLIVRARDRTQIKIEVTPVLRGCVYEPRSMAVSAKVEDQFGLQKRKCFPLKTCMPERSWRRLTDNILAIYSMCNCCWQTKEFRMI